MSKEEFLKPQQEEREKQENREELRKNLEHLVNDLIVNLELIRACEGNDTSDIENQIVQLKDKVIDKIEGLNK